MHGENLFSTNEPFPAQGPRQKLPFKELGSPGEGDNGVVILVCSEKKRPNVKPDVENFFCHNNISPGPHGKG